MKSVKILFITTSHSKMGNTDDKTGVWFEELAAPYYIFKDAGADLTIASPEGGRVPLDPRSQSIIVATTSTKRFQKDEGAMNFLFHSLPLRDIEAEDFDIAFLTGGHGSLWDLAGNEILKPLLEAFNKENKLIAAVSHGTGALLALQNEVGEFLVKGKQLTGFSNSEEASERLAGIVPLLIETELLLRSALYSKGDNYLSHVVTDGNIITGQNPASASEVAKKAITWMQLNQHKALYNTPSLLN